MEECENIFKFIKCLANNDKEEFIKRYLFILNSDEREFKYYDKGSIKVSIWLSIMANINLNNHYAIYRDAY
jgi:hypothetical protein